MDSLFYTSKLITTCVIVAGMLLGGFKVYQGIQRGEGFEGPALRWFTGLLAGSGLIYAVEHYIFDAGGGLWGVMGFNIGIYNNVPELYQALLFLGALLAVLSVAGIYKLFRDGDPEIYDRALLWFGSLVFLFSMSAAITLIMSETF